MEDGVEDGVHVDLDDLDFDREHLVRFIERGHIDARDTTLRDVVCVQLPALILELKMHREAAKQTPLLVQRNYQVMTYDGALVDEPSGGWMPVSSVTDDPEDAIARMRARRARNAMTSPLAVWRRDITWSVHATEDGSVTDDK